MKKFIKPALILLAIIAVLSTLQFTGAGDFLKDIVEKIEGLGAWGPIIFIAIYIISAILFIPASALTIGAGLAFGLTFGFIYTSIGSTLGAAASFLISRFLFRKKVENHIAYKDEFKALDEAVEEEGWKTVALSRLSPIFPYTFLNYAYGLTKVKLWPFLLTSWIAMMPGTLLYVYIGALGNQASSSDQSSLWKNISLGIGLVATIIVTVILTKKAKAKLDDQLDDKAKKDDGEKSDNQ